MTEPGNKEGHPWQGGRETLSTDQNDAPPTGCKQDNISSSSEAQQPTRAKSDGPYFIFPLAALRYGKTIVEQHQAIVCWCCYFRGLEVCEGNDEAAILDLYPSLLHTDGFLDGTDVAETDSLALEVGLFLHQRTCKHAKPAISRARRLEQFCQGTGCNTMVCIRADILDDWVKGAIRDLHFRVLCAIYSYLGRDKPFALIRRSVITARAHGYASVGEFQATLLAKHGGILTPGQLRWALDTLEERGFFARVAFGRTAYYSNRMSREALEEEVFKQARKQAQKKCSTNRQRDRGLQARIKGLKQSGHPPVDF